MYSETNVERAWLHKLTTKGEQRMNESLPRGIIKKGSVAVVSLENQALEDAEIFDKWAQFEWPPLEVVQHKSKEKNKIKEHVTALEI